MLEPKHQPKRVPVCIRLPPELAARLRRLGRLSGASQADIVAEALDRILPRYEKKYCAGASDVA